MKKIGSEKRRYRPSDFLTSAAGVLIALFAARSHGIKDIVLTGNLTTVAKSKDVFDTLSNMFGVHFIIPQNSQFGTVIGTALDDK